MMFGIVGAITLAMTWFSSKRPEILLRIVASFFWLALAFWVILGNTGLHLADIWTGLIAVAFVIMAFVPFIWQMRTEVIRSKGSLSWKSYEVPPLFTKSKRVQNAKKINKITKARRRKQRWV